MTKAQRQRYKLRKRMQRVSQLIRLKDEQAAKPFNPWRVPEPACEPLWAIIRAIIAETQLENMNKYGQPRRRPLSAEDKQKLFELTTAVVSNLVHCHVSGQAAGVFLSRDQRQQDTRYEPDFQNRILVHVLDRLESAGFLKQVLGQRAKFHPFTGQILEVARRTVIHPGQRLISLVDQASITLADVTYKYERPRKDGSVVESQEVLLLKDLVPIDENQPDDSSIKALVEYQDTDTTKLLRTQTRLINSSVWQWEIRQTPWYSGPVIDFKDRQLRRYFTSGFQSGGRLFGGFWQPLSKEQRRDAITINGRLVTELDFSAMGPRILYGLCGYPVPSGDLYAVPGFERSRAAIKVIFNAMLFCTERLKQFPMFDEGKGFHPEEVRPVEDVLRAIEDKHPLLKSQFFTGIGHRVQFIESQITVAIMLNLIRLGIPALPVHDSFIVAEEDAGEVRAVMLRQHRELAGVDGEVHEA